MELIKFASNVKIKSTSLTLPRNMPFKKWQDFGKNLKALDGAIQWCIGDWLKYGEQTFGEKYTQAIDETEYSYGTLRNIKYITDRFDIERRRECLTFAHHKEVAIMDVEDQDYWLDYAEENNLSVRDLHELIKEAESDESNTPSIKDLIESILENGYIVENISKTFSNEYCVRICGEKSEEDILATEASLEKSLVTVMNNVEF